MAAPTDPIARFAKEKIEPHWHNPIGGLLLAVCIGLFGLLAATAFKSEPLGYTSILVYGILPAGLVLLIWLLEHRFPKVPPGRVGILLAISADDDEEAKRIQIDFTRELTRRLKQGRESRRFAVITLPKFWVQDLETSEDAVAFEKIRRAVEKVGGHFFLRGFSRRRTIEGKDYHLLRLQALVRHTTIPKSISAAFSQEMSTLIPKEIRVAVDGDAIAFEATSETLGLGTRYIIGIAAALSGALSYAEELLLEVEQEIKAMDSTPVELNLLEKEVSTRLKELYLKMVLVLSEAYHMRRARELLEAVEPLCQKLLQRDPNNYVAKLQLAIVCFMLRRDVEQARSILNSCKGLRDCTYQYGLAFLLGYEGKLKEAHDAYRTAFHAKVQAGSVSAPLQTEEFINLVIQQEPERNYLLFCTGLVNYNAKRDFSAAKRDFEQFLGIATINSFPWAKTKAVELIKYCDRFAELEGT